MSAFNGLNIDLTTLRQLSYPRAKTLARTVAKKGYFFRETLELLNRSSDVGDAF
jgi:hypothetical protein